MFPKGASRPPTDTPLATGTLVIYENDGVPVVGAVIGQKKERLVLLSERGREVELPRPRLFMLSTRLPANLESTSAKAEFLLTFHQRCRDASFEIALEEIWEALSGATREYSTGELAELYSSSTNAESLAAMRLALLADKIYFRRAKDGFEARGAANVEELKRAEISRQKKQAEERLLVEALRRRIAGDVSAAENPKVDEYLDFLSQLAVRAAELEGGKLKEAKELLDMLCGELRLELAGGHEQRAFALLERVGYFTARTNPVVLRYRPRRQFPREAEEQASAITVPKSAGELREDERGVRLDCTGLEVITIDDLTTRDMDDGLSLERRAGGYRLGIHITDVASAVEADTPLDREASLRATSIYLPEATIPMLPPRLSEENLSLRPGDVRPCISVFIDLGPELETLGAEVRPTLVSSVRKMSYEEVDQLLEDGDPDLTLLYSIAMNFQTDRLGTGAMRITKREVIPMVDAEGRCTLTEIDEDAPSRSLVGEMMVWANKVIADFALDNGFPMVFRSQEAPQEEAPAGGGPEDSSMGPAQDYAARSRLKKSSLSTEARPHAGLGLRAYLQITSPIRRYLDLCNQRQVLAFLRAGRPRYSAEDLEEKILQVEAPLSLAVLTSRESKRFWLLRYLEQNPDLQRELHGTVLRTDLKHPLIEIREIAMPMVVKLDGPAVKPGDEVRLRVTSLNAKVDYIKLERIR